MAGRFANFNLGETFRTSGKDITITGWMDGGGSAFDSEMGTGRLPAETPVMMVD